MQSQQEMEAIIAAKKQEMNSYLDLQKKIRKGGYGRTGYLKFFENGSEITSYYNLLIANNDGEKQKEYQEAQRIFNEKLNANVKLLIEYRKRTHKPKEDGDESSREFEQFVELCELDQKPFEQREEAIKQFVAKWFTITVVNLEDYEKCIARREELDQILAFVRRKYPQDNLLIKELEEGEKRLITAQKNFIGKQIRFLNSRDRVRDISLIVEAETTLKLVSSDKSINRFFEAEVLPGREDKPFDKTFSSEKKKLEGAIQNAKMFNYCEKKF
ncbi:MAG TPA: hypothetical protein VGU44_06075, partial [Gammaproteobacteria bacterium]|nr:hypothetical protein [Gammaproteobacteria bacterium]